MLDEPEKALAHSRKGITVNPDYPTCGLTAAVAAYRLGEKAMAATFIAGAVRDPAFSTIANVKAFLPPASSGAHGRRFLADLRAAGLPK